MLRSSQISDNPRRHGGDLTFRGADVENLQLEWGTCHESCNYDESCRKWIYDQHMNANDGYTMI